MHETNDGNRKQECGNDGDVEKNWISYQGVPRVIISPIKTKSLFCGEFNLHKFASQKSVLSLISGVVPNFYTKVENNVFNIIARANQNAICDSRINTSFSLLRL